MKRCEFQPKSGDHIRVFRGFYWHHGIYIGRGRVVHFSGEPVAKRDAAVRETTLRHFLADGDGEVVVHNDDCFPRRVTARRARSRIGTRGYDLALNNCEHFAWWCKTGHSRSKQVEFVGTQPVAANVAMRALAEGASRRMVLLPSARAFAGVAARAVPVLNVAVIVITGGLLIYKLYRRLQQRSLVARGAR